MPQSYPIPPAAATPSLRGRIAARIDGSGPLRFSEFMAAALYDPQAGYYATGTRQVGRSGDFFTSVSVGPLFGQLLARRFAAAWQDLGKPAAWRITECGAHDGTLANDILDALAIQAPNAYATVEYTISEPLETLRLAHRQTLANHAHLLRSVADAGELAPLPGIVFGNELLDALPFDVVEFRNGRWHECLVACDEDGFRWQLAPPADHALAGFLDTLGTIFPDGYRTEVRPSPTTILQPLRATLSDGFMLWIDYGFTRDDYYHPDRTNGTLRTFSNHHAGEDPLADPGSADITAHVDFTATAKALRELGGTVTGFTSQGSWLTTLARDWLLEQEGRPDPAALRQFQTLTHPGHLGRSFHVLEAAFGPAAAGHPGVSV